MRLLPHHFFFLVCVGCFQFFTGSVHAQSAYGYPFTIVGNTIEYGSRNLTFAAEPAAVFGNAAGGAVYVDSASKVALSTGRELAVVTRSAPAASAVAGALGRFARKSLPLLAQGVALYELGKELGFILDNSTGELVVTKKEDSCVSGCILYSSTLGGYTSPEFSTAAMSQVWIRDYINSTRTPSDFVLQSPTSTTFQLFSPTGYATYYGTTVSRAVPPAEEYKPSTVAEFEGAIQQTVNWRSGSKIGDALRDAVASGESLPLPAPHQITGPSSVQGPSSTTSTPAQNGNPAETTTTSTVTNITYEGNKITTNNVTTTVTNTTVNGEPVTTIEESETEPDLEPVATDTPLGAVPDLYDQKYPDGLDGIWSSRKAELMATPLASLSTSLMPSIPDGGSCPVWMIDLNLGISTWAYGSSDVAPPCWVWDFGKIVILVSALLLARSLIFGG